MEDMKAWPGISRSLSPHDRQQSTERRPVVTAIRHPMLGPEIDRVFREIVTEKENGGKQ
jgi:hypothetical protein